VLIYPKFCCRWPNTLIANQRNWFTNIGQPEWIMPQR
jgi:hypothetical protein